MLSNKFNWIRLFGILCLIFLLSACDVPSENSPATMLDTVPETYMAEPPENSLYTIERGEGSIYLIVNDEGLISAWKQFAADKEAETQSDVIYRSVMEIPIAEPVSFPTVDMLKDRVLNYKLTDRKTTHLLCPVCLGKKLALSPETLREMITLFRKQGCLMFSPWVEE